MADRLIYVSRLVRLPLVGADGAQIGQVADVVLTGGAGSGPPGVNGFVVRVQKRHVFIGAGRVGEIETEGVRLRRGAINLRQFQLRPGEQLVVGELFGRRLRGSRIIDAAIAPALETHEWELATLALSGGGLPSRRKPPVIIGWEEARAVLRDERVGARQAAEIGHLHPVEMAEAIRKLPLSRRRVLADALEDERLADLLEELSEEEQVRIVENLDLERTARVLDEMEADDAADLLGEFTAERRRELLGAMDPDEAAPVRRLLRFRPDTAGGLMTPEPIVLEPKATVARRWRGSATRICARRSPPRSSSAWLRPRRRPGASSASPTSSGSCARRRRRQSAGASTTEPEPVAPETSDQMVAAPACRLRRRRPAGRRRFRPPAGGGDD